MNQDILKIKELLKKADFSDKEIEVYLILLELGRGVVSEISRKSKISRTTGYVILGSLAEKGIVGISGKEPRQEYVAESPEKLLAYLRNKSEEQKKIAEDAENLLPN